MPAQTDLHESVFESAHQTDLKPAKITRLRWGEIALLPLAGAAASLAMPPIHFLPAMFCLGYPAWLLAVRKIDSEFLDHKKFWRGFKIGWLTGFGWFTASLYWLVNALITGGEQFYWLIPFAASLVPAGLAIFWGIGFGLARIFIQQDSRILAIVFCLMILEWLRGWIFTGFPWQSPGMLFAFDPLGFSLASVIGLWGCGVVACCFAFLPAAIAINHRLTTWLVGTLLLALVTAGIAETRDVYPTNASGMLVRMVQPSIPQSQKWKPEEFSNHLNHHIITSLAPPAVAELIVWGETAYNGYLDRDIEIMQPHLAQVTQGISWLLTGGLGTSGDDNESRHNSAYLLDTDASIYDRYDKRYLVPWGEFVPGSRLFPFISQLAGIGNFDPGLGFSQLRMKRRNGYRVRIAPLICYEIIFPGVVRYASYRTHFIVNITNDGWFGDSLGPRQHLAMAQMRAAEQGIPIIRVASNGISAVIDAKGRLTSSIDYNISGWRDGVLDGRIVTVYRAAGDMNFIFMLNLVALGWMVLNATRPLTY